MAIEGVQAASVRDVPSAKDAFGIGPYIDALAAFLVDPRTLPPLTLSIEGEWGAGKTSFMQQLGLILRDRYGHRTLHFNAWRHEKDEALWASFALSFVRELLPKGLAGLRLRLRLFFSRYNLAQGWLALLKLAAWTLLGAISLVWFGIGLLRGDEAVRMIDLLLAKEITHLTTGLAALFTLIASTTVFRTVSNFVGNPFKLNLKQYVQAPNYEGRLPFLVQFHEDFKTVVDVYTSAETNKVFVFIDDLDRCEPAKAAELVQALNLMIPEASKLIFILGIDREKLAAAIALRHEKVLPFLAISRLEALGKGPVEPAQAQEFGTAFLERFIQLPFRLPRLGASSLPALINSLVRDPALIAYEERFRRGDGQGTSLFDELMEKFRESGTGKPQPTTFIEAADSDSPAVRRVLEQVAPALDYNPRRLKQFLNAFRLQAYIASEVGHFHHVAGSPALLTLPKLGKLVALQLWWPRLLDEAEREPGLFHQIESRLRQREPVEVSPTAARWLERRAVMELLGAGLDTNDDSSLSGLDIRALRQISPRVPRGSVALDWRRRASAANRPPAGGRFARFRYFIARAQEGEALSNLKGLFTAERSLFQEKDRYVEMTELDYMPAAGRKGVRPPVPGKNWVGGGRFIYTVEVRGKDDFYGYALGIHGRVQDVEFEIVPHGDWEGIPRRIAPARVDSERYYTLFDSVSGFSLRYPSTLVEEDLSKDGGEHRLVARDASALLTVQAMPRHEWKALTQAALEPQGDKQVLTGKPMRNGVRVTGFVDGLAYEERLVLDRRLVLVMKLRCDVRAKTGYALVMDKIAATLQTFAPR